MTLGAVLGAEAALEAAGITAFRTGVLRFLQSESWKCLQNFPRLQAAIETASSGAFARLPLEGKVQGFAYHAQGETALSLGNDRLALLSFHPQRTWAIHDGGFTAAMGGGETKFVTPNGIFGQIGGRNLTIYPAKEGMIDFAWEEFPNGSKTLSELYVKNNDQHLMRGARVRFGDQGFLTTASNGKGATLDLPSLRIVNNETGTTLTHTRDGKEVVKMVFGKHDIQQVAGADFTYKPETGLWAKVLPDGALKPVDRLVRGPMSHG
jgi:hypothetical protein